MRVPERLDLVVDVATTGAKAIERSMQQSYRWVILDCILPDMSGRSVFEHRGACRKRTGPRGSSTSSTSMAHYLTSWPACPSTLSSQSPCGPMQSARLWASIPPMHRASVDGSSRDSTRSRADA